MEDALFFASGMLDLTLQTMGTSPVLHFPHANAAGFSSYSITHTHMPLFHSLFPVSGSCPEVLQLFLHLHFCAGSSTQTYCLWRSPLLQRQVQCVFFTMCVSSVIVSESVPFVWTCTKCISGLICVTVFTCRFVNLLSRF